MLKKSQEKNAVHKAAIQKFVLHNPPYSEMNAEIAAVIRQAHEKALAVIDERIGQGEYDKSASYAALSDLAGSVPDYDGCYLIRHRILRSCFS